MPRRLAAFALCALCALCLACTRRVEGPLPPGPREPARNLELLESFADRTEREGQLAAWTRSLGLEAAQPPFGVRPLRDLRTEEITTLRAALPREEDRIRLEQVERVSLQLRQAADPAVQGALARLDAARARLRLDDPSLHRVLLESGDESARREAWFALHAGTDTLAALVVGLTRARREWARSAGFDTALEAVAATSGVADATARAIEARVREALRPDPSAPLVEPWNDEAFDPALAARLSVALPAALVLERAEDFARRLDAVPSELTSEPDLTGYSSNASFAIDPPEDVRVRVAPEAGLAGAWRVMHEFGHAVQARLAPAAASPMLQRGRSRAVTEGAAKLAERLAWSPEWLGALGVADADLVLVAQWEARSERARARRILADVELERILHEQPGAALDAFHREAWASVAGLRSPEELSAWAAQRSLSHAPGERLDYLLARCVQAAIYRRLRTLPDGLLGAESTRLLREEILPAAAGADFEQWFTLAAGEPPDCEAWLTDVARLRSGPGREAIDG